MIHSKIMGKAHVADSKPAQKFFGGEYATTKENVLVYVNYSVWTNSSGWQVHVTTMAPQCTSNLFDRGGIFTQDDLEVACDFGM